MLFIVNTKNTTNLLLTLLIGKLNQQFEDWKDIKKSVNEKIINNSGSLRFDWLDNMYQLKLYITYIMYIWPDNKNLSTQKSRVHFSALVKRWKIVDWLRTDCTTMYALQFSDHYTPKNPVIRDQITATDSWIGS